MQVNTDRPRPPAPSGPIICQPWCEYGDGHPEALFAVDQVCFTPVLHVDLSRPGRIRDVDGSMFTPERLQVYAAMPPGNDPSDPEIVISVDEMMAPNLTVAEARQLIEALQLILGQVTG